MGTRPKLSLKAEAAIEGRLNALYKAVEENRFPHLFPKPTTIHLPSEISKSLANISSVFAVSVGDLMTQQIEVGGVPAPRPSKSATIRLEISEYASALYDAEAPEYSALSVDRDSVKEWLRDIGLSVYAKVFALIKAGSLDVHCNLKERVETLQKSIDDRVLFWTRDNSYQRAKAYPVVTVTPQIAAPMPALALMPPPGVRPDAALEAHQGIASARVLPRQKSTVTSAIAARKVASYIEDRVLTQKQFAKKAHTTDRTIRAFIASGTVRKDIFCDIASAMDMTPEMLLSGSGK